MAAFPGFRREHPAPRRTMNVAVIVDSVRSRMELSQFARYFGITEQIVLSATNMLASLAVLKAADVASFGIYSFAFSIATFAGAFFQVLLHRQMTLEISSLDPQERRDVYLATLVIQLLALSTIALLLLATVSFMPDGMWLTEHRDVFVAVMIFVIALNLFDLNRQYLYVCDAQAFSLVCTLVHASVACTALAFIALASPSSQAVIHVYSALATSFAVALIINRRCRDALGAAVWHGWRYALGVLGGYFQHARFSLTGWVVTWAQNQAITPFLMWVGGPLVVGWFSLGRLFCMPLSVIAQGLANTTIPVLRRTWQGEGGLRLAQEIRKLILWNSLAALAYFALLGLAHVTGLLDYLVHDYHHLSPYLLFWALLLFATIFRSWLGQFFIVQMRFRFALAVNLVAVTITLGGMAFAVYAFGGVPLALASVIAGELTSLAIMYVVSRRELASLALVPARSG